MDVGQVKTGDDKDDTYVKMLQEVVRVTAPVAYGIAAKYPNVMSLVRGFKEEGPTALEDLKVSVLCHLRSPLIFFGFCLDSEGVVADLFGLDRNPRIRTGRLRSRGLGRR